MYYIKSIGIAFPETTLDNVELVSLGLDLDPDLNIKKRYLVLNKDYLISTKNSDFTAARANCDITSARLAKLAFERALSSGSMQDSDIGLFWADTLTPWQLTPSEAQRIGCELGLKVASYDVATSAAGLPSLLKTITQLEEQELNPNIAISVVNALSILIDYSKKSLAPQLFSDAAITLICSTEAIGYEILLANVIADDNKDFPFTISMIKHANESKATNLAELKEFCKQRFLNLWPSFAKLKLTGSVTLAASDFGTDFLREISSTLGLRNFNIMPVTAKYGESLNCVTGIGMHEWSKTANVHDTFIGFNPGLGQQYGMFAVRKV